MTEHDEHTRGPAADAGDVQSNGPLDTLNLLARVLLATALFATNVLVQGVVLNYGGSVYLAVTAGAAATLLCCAPLALLDDRTFGNVYHLRGLSVRALGLSALAAGAAFLPTGWLAGWSSHFVAPDPEWLAVFDRSLPHTPGAVALTYLAVSVAAPLAEEIVFRRILYGALRRRLGVTAAVVVSSLLFAFAHWEPWFFLGLAGVGAVAALAYEATGSLSSAVVVHGVHNTVSLTLMIKQGGLLDATSVEASPGLLPALASLSLLIACLVLLLRGRRSA